MKTLQKINDLALDLHQSLVDRWTAIQAAILALLTGEHLVLLGPPGTAKSLLVRELCNRLKGATYFEKLLTKFSTPEELFGPLSLAALEKDLYKRVTAGSLVEAHIAFLDEIFKANSAILNSLLTLINERLYQEAGQVTRVPLLSLFAASNETPEEDGLGALYDRFLLRVEVPYLSEDQSFRALLTMGPSTPQVSLTLKELRTAQNAVMAVTAGPRAIDALVALKRELEGEGIVASDRRWRTSVRLVRAAAWLEGAVTATEDHCQCLTHTLWTKPEERRLVERMVAKVTNPLDLEAIELEDAARDLYDQKPRPGTQGLIQALEPLLKQLDDIHTRLEGRIARVEDRKAARAREALGRVERWKGELGQMALSSLSALALAPGSGGN